MELEELVGWRAAVHSRSVVSRPLLQGARKTRGHRYLARSGRRCMLAGQGHGCFNVAFPCLPLTMARAAQGTVNQARAPHTHVQRVYWCNTSTRPRWSVTFPWTNAVGEGRSSPSIRSASSLRACVTLQYMYVLVKRTSGSLIWGV